MKYAASEFDGGNLLRAEEILKPHCAVQSGIVKERCKAMLSAVERKMATTKSGPGSPESKTSAVPTPATQSHPSSVVAEYINQLTKEIEWAKSVKEYFASGKIDKTCAKTYPNDHSQCVIDYVRRTTESHQLSTGGLISLLTIGMSVITPKQKASTHDPASVDDPSKRTVDTLQNLAEITLIALAADQRQREIRKYPTVPEGVALKAVANQVSDIFQAHRVFEWVILTVLQLRQHAREHFEPQVLLVA